MELSKATSDLLLELDTLSGGSIKRRADLGILLECGRDGPGRKALDELSFFAKFLHRTHGIMARIGRDGEGFDRLLKEFTDASAKTTALLAQLLSGAPDDERRRLTATYLAMTPGALDNLLALCRDLSWYKNRLIDVRARREGAR
ncbi:MAG TPA: hypothetical protein VML00_05585 [Bacteroidota bacterium]|nr:hypothetical protein [Bacteroidota bacterium]